MRFVLPSEAWRAVIFTSMQQDVMQNELQNLSEVEIICKNNDDVCLWKSFNQISSKYFRFKNSKHSSSSTSVTFGVTSTFDVWEEIGLHGNLDKTHTTVYTPHGFFLSLILL